MPRPVCSNHINENEMYAFHVSRAADVDVITQYPPRKSLNFVFVVNCDMSNWSWIRWRSLAMFRRKCIANPPPQHLDFLIGGKFDENWAGFQVLAASGTGFLSIGVVLTAFELFAPQERRFFSAFQIWASSPATSPDITTTQDSRFGLGGLHH